MRIEIITTGSELLLGTTENTHASWLGRELFLLGLRVSRLVTVPDGEAIREALSEAILRADAIIVTGGLGPTSDDLTREISAAVLGLELIIDEAALRSIEAFFAQRGREMPDSNRKQALHPCGADVLPNPNGTAPGTYVPPRLNPHSACAVFLLPGPPREMRPMFHAEVAPRLRALSGMENPASHLTLKFAGVGESDLQQTIDSALAEIPDLELGYCARIGEVDLRLIGTTVAIATARSIALAHFGGRLVSEDGSSLEEVLIRSLTSDRRTLATAESCTGGLIASRLTRVPGASRVFTHGYVTYSNEAKSDMLGVPTAVIDAHGAVSEPVARLMAAGALAKSGADIAIAVTGIAGPTGGTPEKPVGTAWIGVADASGTVEAFKVYHPRNRLDFQLAVCQAALAQVYFRLLSPAV